MDIPTFDEFNNLIVQAVQRAGHTGQVNEGTLIVQTAAGSQNLSLDVLYRTYVDAAVQNPSTAQDQLLAFVQRASNGYEEARHNPAVFQVTEVPNLHLTRALMQGCVTPIT